MPIFSKSMQKDFDKYGISVIDVGGKYFGTLIKVLRAFDFPYFVMCDYDALMHVRDTNKIKRNGKSIKTSAVFYSTRQLLGNDDLEIIDEMESKIQMIGDGRRKKVYPKDYFDKLKDIALSYDVYALPTDFEGVLKRDGYEKIMREARRVLGGRSKVICGRYVAEKIVENKLKIPIEFRDVIEQIVKKS